MVTIMEKNKRKMSSLQAERVQITITEYDIPVCNYCALTFVIKNLFFMARSSIIEGLL